MKIKTALLTIMLILCCANLSFAHTVKRKDLEKIVKNLNFSYEEIYKYQMKHIDSYLKKQGVKQCRIDIMKMDHATIMIEIYIKDDNTKYYIKVNIILDRLFKYQAI